LVGVCSVLVVVDPFFAGLLTLAGRRLLLRIAGNGCMGIACATSAGPVGVLGFCISGFKRPSARSNGKLKALRSFPSIMRIFVKRDSSAGTFSNAALYFAIHASSVLSK
jgi:hypothetical protein